MRTKNSLRNTIISFIANLITIIVGIVAQKVFITILGKEYLGINGLFTNIISMLGVAELGIGSAVIYNLYRPVAENDTKKINALMSFYKKSYRLIAIIILIVGLLITPFLKFFISDVTINDNLAFIYILFIIDSICSYILSYKRSIIIANQKSYIINLIHIIYLLVLNASQIVVLVLTKNFYLYLVIKIIIRILENIVITIKANKMYPYLSQKTVPLDTTTKQDIIKKVKALFFHKIGSFFVLGTDNLIISKFLGVVTVGLYSNYYLVINAIQSVFGQVINVLTPSIGNLLIEENSTKNYQVFQRIRFLNFWIATFSSVAILVTMNSFITIWLEKEYLLSTFVLLVLVFEYFQKSMRTSYMSFKEAAGIYYEDRFCPLIESILNIVASIILLKYFKLAGVFMGTIVSSIVLWGYSYPKYVYKKLFNRNYLDYLKETLGYIIVFVLIASISYFVASITTTYNIYLTFLINLTVAITVPNVLLLLLFHKTANFNYYLSLIRSIRKKG